MVVIEIGKHYLCYIILHIQMHYLRKNPSGEINLNFDNMTGKMMRDKVRSLIIIRNYLLNLIMCNPFCSYRNTMYRELLLRQRDTALI